MNEPAPNIPSLVSAMIDDDDPHRRDEFLSELEGNEELQVQFVRQMIVDSALQELLGTLPAQDLQTPAPPPPKPLDRRGATLAVWFSLAAVVLIGIIFWTGRPTDTLPTAGTQKLKSRTLADNHESSEDAPTNQKAAENAVPRQAISPEEAERRLIAASLDTTIKLAAGPLGRAAWNAGMALPAVQAAREAARKAQTRNNLTQIGLALHNYHDQYQAFPAAYSADEQGKPLLSWRVHLLPFLEQEELYSQFHLDEPWDSEHNRALIDKMPTVFSSAEIRSPGGKANLLAVENERGVLVPPRPEQYGKWNPQGVTLKEIIDGTSHTIVIIEVNPSQAVPWTKPADYQLDADQPLTDLGHPDNRNFFQALLADGSVQTLEKKITSKMLIRMLTRDGGEAIEAESPE